LNVRSFVGKLLTHILLSSTELRGIDSDEQSLDTSFLGVLNNLAGDFTILVDVELHELNLARLGGIDNLVERARCERGNHLDERKGELISRVIKMQNRLT